MYFKQDAPRIIKKIYESDTQDPLTDCQNALAEKYNNDSQRVIFIQEYLEQIDPDTIQEHLEYIKKQNPSDFYIYVLPEYNIFNILALVKKGE